MGSHIILMTPNNPSSEQGQLQIQTTEEKFTQENICKTFKIWWICVATDAESARPGRGKHDFKQDWIY